MTDAPANADRPGISPEALFAALEHIDEVIVVLEVDGTITFVSPGLKSMLGWEPADFVGRNLTEILEPRARPVLLESLARWSGRNGQVEGEPFRALTSFGTWATITYDALTGPALGGLGPYVLTLRTLDSRHHDRIELLNRLSNEARIVRLGAAFLGVGLDQFDVGLNAAIGELSGLTWVTRVSVWYESGDVVARRGIWEASNGAPSAALPRALSYSALRPLDGCDELHLSSPDAIGSGWPELAEMLVGAGVRGLLAVPIRLRGRLSGFLMIEHTYDDGAFDSTHFSTLRAAAGMFADAFARNDAERELLLRARTDALTGLPNRWTFQTSLDEELRGGDPSRRDLVVALIALDRFKRINDSLGHNTGDHLLVEVAERLETAVGADGDGAAARLGGDEFLVRLRGCRSDAEALDRMRRVASSLAPPFTVDDQPISLTASVGMTRVSGNDASAAELLSRAGLAMHRAKQSGGNRIATEDATERVQLARRLSDEGELRAAVDHQVVAYLQGEWELATGKLVGAEALARWIRPDLGIVGADGFIAMAEESDLIVALGEHVLGLACDEAARWRREGFEAPFVTRVNLSARQLRHPAIVEVIAERLESARLDPVELCLELTESALLGDPPAAARVLGQIRAIGCGVVLDDFGTGYSSLSYLKDLPLTGIKIDRTFVAGLPRNTTDRAIVACVVELASSLGITVTAEGIETESQRGALLELGCHYAQGFLFSEPEPMDRFSERILGHSPPPARPG